MRYALIAAVLITATSAEAQTPAQMREFCAMFSRGGFETADSVSKMVKSMEDLALLKQLRSKFKGEQLAATDRFLTASSEAVPPLRELTAAAQDFSHQMALCARSQ